MEALVEGNNASQEAADNGLKCGFHCGTRFLVPVQYCKEKREYEPEVDFEIVGTCAGYPVDASATP